MSATAWSPVSSSRSSAGPQPTFTLQRHRSNFTRSRISFFLFIYLWHNIYVKPLLDLKGWNESLNHNTFVVLKDRGSFEKKHTDPWRGVLTQGGAVTQGGRYKPREGGDSPRQGGTDSGRGNSPRVGELTVVGGYWPREGAYSPREGGLTQGMGVLTQGGID